MDMRKTMSTAALCFLILGTGLAWAGGDGIWKDVPKAQPDDRYALYVQTYLPGSVVVVLLDNTPGTGAQTLYAFLDEDFIDGVDANELGGADAHLVMSNPDQASPLCTFTVNGVSTDFALHKWFDAPIEDAQALAADGIYKDTPSPGETSFNVYLQTYDPEGSAVAIVTDNGGMTYDVFVDADFSNGFDAAGDLLGRGAQLALSDSQEGDYAFTYTAPGSPAQTGLLHRWFQAPEVSYTLGGSMTYAGIPMPMVTMAPPSVTAWDNEFLRLRTLNPTYDSSTGEYELTYVPGDAFIIVTFPESSTIGTLPGNFMYKKDVVIPSLTAEERTAFDVELELMLHLTNPYDSGVLAPTNELESHTSPVTFEWESVPEATHYELKIDRFRSSEHPDYYGYIETMVSEDDLMTTTYAANLPASAPLEHYEFYLYAVKNETRIGYLTTTLAQGGYREHYRFLIE
jgi:hypothetical protein